MKNNISLSDVQEALARVEKAKANHLNASRRLSRAKETIKTAEKDAAEAEAELKQASSALDQVVRKAISHVMKKGNVDMRIAIAEVLTRGVAESEDTEDHEDEDSNSERVSSSASDDNPTISDNSASMSGDEENDEANDDDADENADVESIREDSEPSETTNRIVSSGSVNPSLFNISN